MIKRILMVFSFLFLFTFAVNNFSYAGNLNSGSNGEIFLENLPGLKQISKDDFKKDNSGKQLTNYVNWIIKTSVILGSMLAVGFIIYGGILYMTSEAFSGKSAGKEHLTNAIGGLIFLIGGYLIFTQINPNILNFNFSTASGRVDVSVKEGNITLDIIESSGSSHGYGGDIEYDDSIIKGDPKEILIVLNEEGEKYGINNILEKAHFLAQAAHESANFTSTTEKGYKLDTAKRVFSSNYDHCLTVDNPVAIFNCVYGGRLGNTEPGDGNKYRGRGLIQITGKNNYKRFMEFHNRKYPADIQDFVANPNLIAQAPYASRSALWFWQSNGLGSYAVDDTKSTVTKISKGVNCGSVSSSCTPNGLEDRWNRFQKIYSELDK